MPSNSTNRFLIAPVRAIRSFKKHLHSASYQEPVKRPPELYGLSGLSGLLGPSGPLGPSGLLGLLRPPEPPGLLVQLGQSG